MMQIFFPLHFNWRVTDILFHLTSSKITLACIFFASSIIFSIFDAFYTNDDQ